MNKRDFQGSYETTIKPLSLVQITQHAPLFRASENQERRDPHNEIR